MVSVKDIRIGDYFRVTRDGLCIKNGTIVQVRGIDGEDKLEEKGLVGAAHCHPLDEYQFDGGIWVDYLDPIPLTAEILEKNEFEMGSSGNYWFSDEDEGLEITFFPKGKNYTNGAYDFVDIYKGCLSIIELPVGFVHELQHALRLCGIDKEIEL